MKNNPETSFYNNIKSILSKARTDAYHAINFAMVEAYWLIGKRIVEEEQSGEQKAAYGEAILKNLSAALSAEFGKGFSYANLRNFRQFYLTYPGDSICYAVRSKLIWTHHRMIMRLDNSNARAYYMEESEKQNWSTRTVLPSEKELADELARERIAFEERGIV